MLVLILLEAREVQMARRRAEALISKELPPAISKRSLEEPPDTEG